MNAPYLGLPEHAALFEPVTLGPVTLPNRLVQVPHCTGFGTRHPAEQAALRRVKAEGGWGAVFTEYCSVHPSCDDAPWVPATLHNAADVAALALMTDAVHEHGALAGTELWYGGLVGAGAGSRLPAYGVSQMVSDQTPGHSVIEMDQAEIRELQGWYVQAALRAVEAGFDLISLGAQEADNIFTQFLMLAYNKRPDCYGGSLENRARFLLETLEQVRSAVDSRAAVGVRLCIDTLDGTGQGIRAGVEGRAVIGMADPLADYWDVQAGGWGEGRWGTDPEPSRFAGENFQAGYVKAVRDATAKPLAGVGRFTDPDTMVTALGWLDVIAAARPSIADPFLPEKIRTGRTGEIRRCIGGNYCVSRFSRAVPVGCAQNPAMGQEHARGWHPEHIPPAADPSAPVLVVGAGPAGLECAVTLGKAGYAVHLADAAPAPGGCLRQLASLPGMGDWQEITGYRLGQITRLPQVELCLNTRLDADAVLGYGAGIVVVATGARWDATGMNWATLDVIPGAGLGHVLTPDRVLAGEVPDGRVVIYDCDGWYTAPGLAEILARQGRSVEIVTPHASLAPHLAHTFEAARLGRHLRDSGITITTGTVISEITPGLVVTPGGETSADCVVLVTQRRSDDALWRELAGRRRERDAAGISAVYRAGDCLVPREVADAVFHGREVALGIAAGKPA